MWLSGAWKLWSTPWLTYVPTWTGLTVGNGTVNANYQVQGYTAVVRVGLIFGSTTVVAGVFRPSMPLSGDILDSGTAWAFDSSATAWAVGVFVPEGYFLFGSGRATVSAPFASWGPGDGVRATIVTKIP